MNDWLDEMFAQQGEIPPPPLRFDRIVVRDADTFGSIPRLSEATITVSAHLPLKLLGFPVVVDEELEPGVVELRMGDETVEVVRL